MVIFVLSSFSFSPLHAQLWCDNSQLCTSPTALIGVGGQNIGIPGSGGPSFSLSVTRNTNYGGAMVVTNSVTGSGSGAYGIYAECQVGIASFGKTNSGIGISGLSQSGSAVFGETTLGGYAIHGKASGPGPALAGYFEGEVVCDGDVDAEGLTIDAGSNFQFGVAHFRAGADRQVFVVPNLSSAHFNGMSQGGEQ